RRHCRILRSSDGLWLVEDLGSQAGTLVDGLPIRAPTRLQPGAELELGSMRARLGLGPAGSGLSGGLARDGRHVERLVQSLADLGASEDLDELLRTIVDRAVRLAGADRGALLLAGPREALEAGIARDGSGRDLPLDQSLTRSLPRRALQSGRAVVLTDTEAP